MLLFLARHGETKWNRLGKTQGTQDICLSNLGRAQAEKLGEYLKVKERITAIYCSDLSRARETAEIIGNQLLLDPISDSLLREISFGSWEGLSTAEIEDKYPGQLMRWRNELSYCPKGGENLLSVCTRVGAFVDMLRESHPGNNERILVISHSVTVKVLILSLLDIPLNLITRFKVNQTGLSLINMEGTDNAALYLNNTHHLEP